MTASARSRGLLGQGGRTAATAVHAAQVVTVHVADTTTAAYSLGDHQGSAVKRERCGQDAWAY